MVKKSAMETGKSEPQREFRGASSRTKAGENSQGRDLEATPPQKGNNPKASRGPDPRNQKRGKTKRAKNPRGAGLDPRELFR